MNFKITYKDPETQVYLVKHVEFSDSENVSAKEWADDYGYSLADKGWYRVEVDE